MSEADRQVQKPIAGFRIMLVSQQNKTTPL